MVKPPTSLWNTQLYCICNNHKAGKKPSVTLFTNVIIFRRVFSFSLNSFFFYMNEMYFFTCKIFYGLQHSYKLRGNGNFNEHLTKTPWDKMLGVQRILTRTVLSLSPQQKRKRVIRACRCYVAALRMTDIHTELRPRVSLPLQAVCCLTGAQRSKAAYRSNF